jgi:hypothetical protein
VKEKNGEAKYVTLKEIPSPSEAILTFLCFEN